MKTYFKTAEIFHIWAHNGAQTGRCPGNVSFEGDVFYSYGTAIGRRIEHKGKPATILNRSSYSVTTSASQGELESAVNGTVFYIGGIPMGSSMLEVTPDSLFAYAIEQAGELEGKAKRARVNGSWYQEQAATWMERAREVSEFFGLRRKVDAGAIIRLRKASQRAEKARLKSELEEAHSDGEESDVLDMRARLEAIQGEHQRGSRILILKRPSQTPS